MTPLTAAAKNKSVLCRLHVKKIRSASVNLSGRCAEVAAELGIDRILISITHTDTHAMASAIGLSK